MIQDKVKVQLSQIKKQGEKLQVELNKSMEVAKAEGQRILKELGVDTSADKIDLNELVVELRKANPTVRDFLRNLNVATYDNRFRFNWNATMMSAYAKHQAEKAYQEDIKPLITEVRASVAGQLREVQEKGQELRSKITA
jgi:hypothetical protein